MDPFHRDEGPTETEGVFDGLKPGAILFGAVIDNLTTFLVSIPLAVAFLPADVLEQNDTEAIRAAFEDVSADPGYLLWALGLGLGCTVFGAFVGARRAGQLHLRHGGWISVISAAFYLTLVLVSGLEPGPQSPLWIEATHWLLLVPAGLLGGEIARRWQFRHSA